MPNDVAKLTKIHKTTCNYDKCIATYGMHATILERENNIKKFWRKK